MLKFKTKHFLTGEELTREELSGLLDLAETLKAERKSGTARNQHAGQIGGQLYGKNVALLFEKPSLRTHLSFHVAVRELGGNPIESFSFARKKEEPEDVVRVLAGYCDAVMLRTFEHTILDRMAAQSPIPIINGLSDSHHPCQVLADLQALKQSFGKLQGLKLAYIGDGNNMLHSLLLLLPFLGIDVRYACPAGFEPNAFIVRKARSRAKEGGGSIAAFQDPKEAAQGSNALYTDVWTSMGFEKEEADREKAFEGYQVNDELYSLAAPGAIVMHCMPMNRGKEISDSMADHANSVLFRQSENRLHAQKALILGLMNR